MKNKILGALFVAYRDPKKPTFASRWMNRHGRWLIEDPAKVLAGRRIHSKLIDSYYYTKDDRHHDGVGVKRWMADSLFVNTYRRYQERTVAVATAFASFALCMVALAPLIPMKLSEAGIASLGSIGCESYVEDIAKGEIKSDQIDHERYSKCIEALSKKGGDK